MKLLKTIKKLIQEAEEQYNIACEGNTPIEELDRLEKNYKNSLKLLSIHKKSEEKKKSNNQ
jgi:hypothetical protein